MASLFSDEQLGLPPQPKKPPCRFTPEFLNDFRELLKTHDVDFTAFNDDGKVAWRFISGEMTDGKFPIFIVDFETFADAVHGVK